MNIITKARAAQASLSLRTKLVALSLAAAVPVLALVVFYVFPLVDQKFLDGKIQTTQATVEVVQQLLADAESKVRRGELGEAEAKARALETVRGLRYFKSEYFWLHDLQNRMVMHPITHSLNDKDLTTLRDASGKPFFQEMTRVSREKGEGMVSYLWPKSGGTVPVPKISYVKLFGPWGWIVGSGVYVDDVHAMAWAFKRNVLLVLAVVFGLSLAAVLVFSGRLAGALSEAIHLLRQSSDTVSGQSQQLAEASRMLSSAVSQAASSLQQTSASIEDVGKMASRSADSASQSSRSAESSRESASDGRRAVTQMVSSMEEISHSNDEILAQVKASNQRISQIVAVIQEIERKTKVINDIVFQTKLLSFNASVEAARAGEHGKGFSVVAEEVGKLALMSGSAAEEISHMLEESVHTVQQIVSETSAQVEQLVGGSHAKVKAGTQVAQSCGESLERILRDVNGMGVVISEIAQACEAQVEGIKQVLGAVSQLKETTQTNASSSTQVAKSSDQMLDQARSLGELTEKLTLLVEGA